MPGKLIPCALCQQEAATVYCVNDDANLCSSCDASVHATNPLLARHERRPIAAMTCQAECASAAHGSATHTDGDVAVVPQFGEGEAEAEVETPAAAPAPKAAPYPAGEPAVAPAPLTLYEDSFFARSLSASDMLDLDADELELPGSAAAPFSFDPMVDCVVPSFENDLHPASGDRYFQVPSSSALGSQQSSFLSQQAAYPYMVPSQQLSRQQQPGKLVPLGGIGAPSLAARPMALPKQRTPEEEAEEAARVARHRERQRKKRNFGRAVRYQSRRAYAEIRPRIKGRFVTPEEYAAYQAQAAAEKAGTAVPGSYQLASSVAPPAPVEEDAVVPMPTFVA